MRVLARILELLGYDTQSPNCEVVTTKKVPPVRTRVLPREGGKKINNSQTHASICIGTYNGRMSDIINRKVPIATDRR